jgi:hypothetical protein
VVDESDWPSGCSHSEWFREGPETYRITFTDNLYDEGKLLALAKAYQDCVGSA